MRRLAGIVVTALFAVALVVSAARADRLAPQPDLLTVFALETFGRAPVGAPAFAAPANIGGLDRSRAAHAVRLDGLQRRYPGALKGLAFHDADQLADTDSLASNGAAVQVASLPASAALPALDAQAFTRAFAFGQSRVSVADAGFHPSTGSLSDATASNDSSTAFVNLAGLENALAPAVSSERFGPVSGAVGFETLSSQVPLSTASLGSGLANYVSGVQVRDDRLAARTGFDVRAGARNVNVQFGTSLDRLTRSDAATFSYVPAPADTLDQGLMPTAQSLLTMPGVADLTRRQINASLAVPVTQNLTLGLQYNTQRYNGIYGSVIEPNVDTRNDAYLGRLSYAIPRTSSVITFSARQLRFQDNLAPASNSWQTREDVKLTVKF